MGLYLDTSDVVAVEALSHTFPLAGVTTNSSIIAVGKKPLNVMLPQLHEVMSGQGCLFVQVMTTTAEGMMNDMRKSRSIIMDVVVKVPVTAEGLVTIRMLKAEGIPTLGAAIYNATRGLLSALVNVEYVAPCANHIDAQGGSDIQTMIGLHQLLEMHAPQVRVLAASLKTPHQALDCLLAGCESITLPLDVVQQAISYPVVEVAMAKFEQDWLGASSRASI